MKGLDKKMVGGHERVSTHPALCATTAWTRGLFGGVWQHRSDPARRKPIFN
jgi:hypothetical protein